MLSDNELEDELDELNNNRLTHPKRYIRDGENPFDFYLDEDFRKRFRFSKVTVVEVLLPLVISDETEKASNRGLPIPPLFQLLYAIRFYATGCYQRVIGDLAQISQATSCRIINRISRILAGHMREYVKFPPYGTSGSNIQRFYQIAEFPGVSACIDGTHIPIENPGGDHAEVYRNRKGRFSLNVQAAVGANQEFFDMVVRHPGSVHDTRIFENSRLKILFEQRLVKGILLGDSGYPCRDYLLTPLLNPNTPAEERYNRAHIKTRNIVERTFGVWKRRFPCLHRGLTNKLPNTVAIICATAVLHNISRQVHDELPDDEFPFDDPREADNDHVTANRPGQRNRHRQYLIDTHFT